MVKWSKTAITDLRKIHNYISEDSETQVKQLNEDHINAMSYNALIEESTGGIIEINKNPQVESSTLGFFILALLCYNITYKYNYWKVYRTILT